MVLPLALPLIGIAGAAAAAPFYERYRERRRGEYASGLLADIPDDDLDAQRRALLGGGLLSGDEFLRMRGGDVDREDRQAHALGIHEDRMALGARNAAVAEGRLGLGREELQFRRQQAAEARARAAAAAEAADIREREEAELRLFEATRNAKLYGTPQERELLANPFVTPETVETVQGALARRASEAGPQVPPVLAQQAEARGPVWLDLQPEVRREVVNVEAGVETMRDVVDYVDNSTGVGRLTDAERAAVEQEFTLTALPYLQRLFQAQAMQQAEQELFLQLAGDPTSMWNLSGAQPARLRNLLARMEREAVVLSESYGLRPQLRPEVPSGLTPVE